MERNTERTHFTREPPTGRTTPPRRDPSSEFTKRTQFPANSNKMKPLAPFTKRTHFPRRAATDASSPSRLWPKSGLPSGNSPNAIISLIYTNPLLHLAGLYGKLSSSSSMSSRFPARDLSPIAIIIVVIVAGPA
jgi:hypothetical protein